MFRYAFIFFAFMVSPMAMANCGYAVPVKAVDFSYQGEYKDVNADLIVSTNLKFKMSVGSRGCAGEIEGDVGATKTSTVFLISKDRECVVTIKRNSDGSFSDSQESSGCMTFHGAACSFTLPGNWEANK